MRQSISDFFRTKVVVASSAAALVSERGYKSMPTNKSTGVFKKMSFFFGAAETRPFPQTI